MSSVLGQLERIIGKNLHDANVYPSDFVVQSCFIMKTLNWRADD